MSYLTPVCRRFHGEFASPPPHPAHPSPTGVFALAAPGPDIRRDSAVLFNLLRGVVGKKKVGLAEESSIFLAVESFDDLCYQRAIPPVGTRSLAYPTPASPYTSADGYPREIDANFYGTQTDSVFSRRTRP